jgi:hypothetical protein
MTRFFLLLVLAAPTFAADAPPRAARSVHLGYPAPEAAVFYTELVVGQSTPGSYFMACGWNTGYFGIQELADGRKVAIFSVWDPTKGDDANAVKNEERVEVLHTGEGVRIRRFGGEGTGGQCLLDFDWRLGATNRFVVQATVQGEKTAYAGWLWMPERRAWQHLVTFRTRTGGQPLKGLYSFVEDFRRDFKSVHEVRSARFGNGWVRTTQGEWLPLRRARFTASNADWEAKENIDAGRRDGWFYLATGGDTKRSRELRSEMTLPEGAATPPEMKFLRTP